MQPHGAQKLTDIRGKVRSAYTLIAERPADKHAIPVGRELAEGLGYPGEILDALPQRAVEAFAGVSSVPLFAHLPPGSVVLDLGCGAGMDSLIAAQQVGAEGLVVGIDFSEAMLHRAKAAAREAAVPNLRFIQAESEHLPLRCRSVDVALVNGIFNLNPLRAAIFAELARVLRPGGSVYGAELILAQPHPESAANSETDWFAWIAGAKEGVAFLEEFRRAGFTEARFLRTIRNARSKNPLVLAGEFCVLR